MVQQHRKSCHTTQSIQRSIVVSLFHMATFSGARRTAQLPLPTNVVESLILQDAFKASSLTGLTQDGRGRE
jgi:hypothetical protein